jgi:ribosomal protein S12 methylthiotransferase accessory factor
MAPTELVTHEATPLAASLARLRRLASSHVGIACQTFELLHAPDEPPLVRVGCRTAAGAPVIGSPVSEVTGGASDDPDAALAAALGEAAERYSASFVPTEALVVATAEELGDLAVAPERFALYSPAQYALPGFPFDPFDRTTRIAWAVGFALPGAEPAYLPAQLVYLAWPRRPPLIGHGTSNGLACAATLEEAILGGLLEVLERDAFMITWANRLSFPALDWRVDADLVRFERRYLAPTGLGYAAFDLSAFWDVPTAVGVVRDRSPGGIPLTVGAGCAPTAAEAVRKALIEAFSVRTWVGRLLSLGSPRSFREDALDVETFDDHVLYYADERRAAAADFLDASSDTVSIADVPALPDEPSLALVRLLAERLAAKGSSAYALDVTAPDVRAAGLRVAKVLAPELCALDVFHGARFLGGRRLYEAAHELRLRPAPLPPDQINPAPHPFP